MPLIFLLEDKTRNKTNHKKNSKNFRTSLMNAHKADMQKIYVTNISLIRPKTTTNKTIQIKQKQQNPRADIEFYECLYKQTGKNRCH